MTFTVFSVLIEGEMKQVFRRALDPGGKCLVLDIPAPVVADNEVLVATSFSLVSAGTESATLKKSVPELGRLALTDSRTKNQIERTLRGAGFREFLGRVQVELKKLHPLGYSGSGVVIEIGRNVDRFHVGDTVAFAGAGHAEYVSVPQTFAVKVPEGLAAENAAWGTVGAIALQGIRRLRPELRETVVVIGLGLLGQIAARILASAGTLVIASDPSEERRRRFSEATGGIAVPPSELEEIVQEASAGRGADGVLVAAKSDDRSVINQALRLCRERGRVIILGLVRLDFDRDPFWKKELDVGFSRSYGPGIFDPGYRNGLITYPPGYVRWPLDKNLLSFLEMLRDGAIAVNDLLDIEVPIERAQEAYDAITDGRAIAALLSYPCSVEKNQDVLAAARSIKIPATPIPKKQPRLGFIGTGGFVQATLGPMFLAAGAAIPILCSRSGVSARTAAELLRSGTITTDIEEVLSAQLDAVVIATRHDQHAALAVRALKAGKAVFVEKPPALTPDEYNALLGEIERNPRPFFVGLNRRFAPLARRMFEYLAGTPGIATYTVMTGPIPNDHWTLDPVQGGGRLLAECDHFFDFLNRLSESSPTRVTAYCTESREVPFAQRRNFRVSVEYDNGALGTLVFTTQGGRGFPREKVEWHGGGRSIVLEDFRKLTVYGKRKDGFVASRDLGHKDCCRSFLRYLSTGSPEGLSPSECLEASRTTLAAAESLRRGIPILL
ncbi:MAG: hypothetical protein D6679_00825 [Candidatus Hydrogenedentota bacterium]|nr:MAG: hypothetical protein D6679_00825 [Candidatus Hydrogenedentota bacterium]